MMKLIGWALLFVNLFSGGLGLHIALLDPEHHPWLWLVALDFGSGIVAACGLHWLYTREAGR